MLSVGRLGIAVLVVGCGGGQVGDPPVEDAAPTDAPPSDVDLSGATWELEPIDGAGDSAFGVKMSFDGDGRALAVWQLNDASAIGFAVRDQGTWRVELISPPGVTGVFAPDVAGGDGSVAHIVFSASSETNGSDIMYVRWDGSSLSPPTNLTGAGQAMTDGDYSPTIAATGDQVTVLYTFQTSDLGDRAVRAVSFTSPGSPGGFETVLAASQDCGSVRARADGGGRVHAVALCRGSGDEVVYASNRSGEFISQSASFPSDSLVAPDLDVGSDDSVHIVAQARVPCGDASCTVPLYSINLAPAIPVTLTTESYFSPAIALDAADQPVIVFFELPDRNLWWTFGDDAGFFRRQEVTPGGGKLVGTGQADPETGLPWFIIEERSQSPAVWLARLVP